ncbi:hypothetical protein C8A05DRAFT_40000 [Staphylotrichum tortipilum]|uniref:Uncharacterized protein n=1 Tax=Staphylotrichum tortipilum TaxID=2831512 RepID=A0AAN6RMK5_9PEZI|nr:hypothetical protein C8A05DRAFT_40000 [Staphylotrichum longicolle]
MEAQRSNYQALRKDLDGFVKVLMQVGATYPQCEFTPFLEGLDTAAKETVDDCAGLIREALDRWQKKYH